MPQVPGAASLENSLSLKDKLLWSSPSEAYGKKEDGRGSGDKLTQHGKFVGGIAYSAAPLTQQKTLEDNLKEDANHRDAILKTLHKKKYEIDFHGYTRHDALKELEDIIISLAYNMKGRSEQQFTVITGKGNHSPNGKPVIKDAVLDYLSKKDIKHEQQKSNFGRTIITVYKVEGTKKKINVKEKL